MDIKCPSCGKTYVPDLLAQEGGAAKFASWKRDHLLVQNVWPQATADQREQLLTGVCSSDCWDNFLGVKTYIEGDDEPLVALRTGHPLLWQYVTAAIDESSGCGQENLQDLLLDNKELADKAEAELVATGLTPKEIRDYVYEGDPSQVSPLSATAEEYVGMYF